MGEQLRHLTHRGPDASGSFSFAHGAIGQTRLSVIDLETGDPPIGNEDGTVGVALNGEIYNFPELRRELAGKGHVFSTSGDTEVIAHLAEDLEPVDLARRLDGMFAFAVWDGRVGRLILARDRFGKKPLYYWFADGRLVFASEIKSLHAHPWVPRDLNPQALPAYLTFGYVPTPQTFYRGIYSLPPASVLEFRPGATPTVRPYWSLPAPLDDDASTPTFDEAAHRVRGLLTSAVEKRLLADVPVGAFLSGGVDSSAVVGIMSELSSNPVRTFTIGFEDTEGFDERPFARSVADRFSTDHTEFVVKPDAVGLIERLVWHYDQPFGDSSAVPTFLVSELTRKHVTVALSGDGGDEIFAGYERFAAAIALRRYVRTPRPIRALVHRLLHLATPSSAKSRLRSLQRFTGRAEVGLPDAFMSWISFMDEDVRQRLLPGADAWAHEDYRAIWASSRGASMLRRLLQQNLRTYLLDDLLPKVDRTSMAHGLEVRSPFLDHHLAAYSLSLPDGFHLRGFRLKRLLKASVADLLPSELLTRRKQGFGLPLDRWLRHDLRDYTVGMLTNSSSHSRKHLDPEALDSLVSQHMNGRANNGHALWALLTLEVWLRREGW